MTLRSSIAENSGGPFIGPEENWLPSPALVHRSSAVWAAEGGVDLEAGWAEAWVQGLCVTGVGSSWSGLAFGLGSSGRRLRGVDDMQIQKGMCLKEVGALLD